MAEKNCIFCNHKLIEKEILWNYNNFFIKVGVGILGPGHIMLVSKKHISCFGELPEGLKEEFKRIKEEVNKKVEDYFYRPIIFEQGAYGQSVNHAHLHFVPEQNDLYNLKNIKEKFSNHTQRTEIKNILEICKIFKEEGSYFYLEENGEKWIFHTKNLPERVLSFRKEFAKFTGLKELKDWRIMNEEEKRRNMEWVNKTKTIFKIANNYKTLNSKKI